MELSTDFPTPVIRELKGSSPSQELSGDRWGRQGVVDLREGGGADGRVMLSDLDKKDENWSLHEEENRHGEDLGVRSRTVGQE